jgi:hypothetical protein
MYTPVAFSWIFNAIRYRSITLPLLANPKLCLSGMVGVKKSDLFKQAQGICRDSILPWQVFTVNNNDSSQQCSQWLETIKAAGIDLPFVCKPDIGCRGSGVKLVHKQQELADIIESYPAGTSLMLQQLAQYKPEAGVFYVKMPYQEQGKVVSLTFKHSPHICGDGVHSLKELLMQDSRAKNLLHLYQARHQENWHKIIAKGKEIDLIFSASHCQGAVFEDARKQITDELNHAIENIMQGLPEFYYGRLDVKFKNLESLKKGKTIEIIEINGASAESIHIWDKNTSFMDAIKTLLWQYKTLFILGDYNRKKGYKPPGIMAFFKHWRIEKKLSKYYPDTD